MTYSNSHPLEFFLWRHDLEKELFAGSQVVMTGMGEVEYAIKGEDGPVIAGIHGGPGGYDQTLFLWNDLVSRGFRLLSFSRPGYLRTPLSSGLDFSRQADFLAALMDFLDIKSAGVIGFSAGGTCALEFAINHPDRIWGLVLESAVCKRYEWAPAEGPIKHMFMRLMFNDPAIWLYNLMAEHAPRLALKQMLEMESTYDEQKIHDILDRILDSPEHSRKVVEFIRTMSPARLRKTGLENDLARLAELKPLSMEKISSPTLIIHGTQDGDVPFAHARLMEEKIPDARLMAVEGGFHVLALTDAAERIREKRAEFLLEIKK